MMNEIIDNVPEKVLLVHHQVGLTHVFTCEGAPGLHIGSGELQTAFEGAVEGLSRHFSELTGKHVVYEAEKDFEEFARFLESPGEGLDSGFVIARQLAA